MVFGSLGANSRSAAANSAEPLSTSFWDGLVSLVNCGGCATEGLIPAQTEIGCVDYVSPEISLEPQAVAYDEAARCNDALRESDAVSDARDL